MNVAHRSLWIEVAFLTLLLVVALTCFHASPAQAAINAVLIIPEQPTNEDSVIVKLQGSFTDGCWAFQSGTCGESPAGNFLVDVYMTDGWHPGGNCPAVMTSYSQTCAPGRLAPGTYTITARQYGQSMFRPEYEQKTVQFTVSAWVPARTLTWSAIKTRY